MKIFISGSYYVEVDQTFCVTSGYAIGSAGCVLELQADGLAPRALKIPLLRATNLGENLLLCKLLLTEGAAVNTVARGRNMNLVKEVGLRGLASMCGRLQITSDPLYEEQGKGVLAVAFTQTGQLQVINSALLPEVDVKEKELASVKNRLSADLVSTIVAAPTRIFYLLAGLDASVDTPILQLEGGANAEKKIRPVFFNVPSIVYEWKPCNLQADISTGLLDSASFASRVDVVLRMLKAVGSLHASKVLHCDIRPANIFRSHVDPADPHKKVYSDAEIALICGSYELGDYGSLNVRSPVNADDQPPFGDTIIGPAVAVLRTSLFYAPERRVAAEFEDANLVTISPAEGGQCRVDLTWASYQPLSFRKRSEDKLPDIRPGDSVRVRDLVFTIRSRNDPRPNIATSFMCDRTVARIVHNRLSVLETFPADEQTFAISGYVIIRQWSRATDMFSIGVLLLYLLFSKASKGPAEDDAKALDARFAEFLETVCAGPYFRAFWARLSLFAASIFAARDARKIIAETSINQVDGKAINITDYAQNVTNDLTASCPYLDTIFESVSKNSARFLLTMWFAMGCIHRNEDLPATARADAGKYSEPFCKSRSDDGNAPGEADRADEILKDIQALIDPNLTQLDAFQLPTVAEFSLKSDHVIRLLLRAMEKDITKLQSALEFVDKATFFSKGSAVTQLIDTARQLSRGPAVESVRRSESQEER